MKYQDLSAQVLRVKKAMNRVETLNELQRCLEQVTDKYHLPTDAWEIWFRGNHLGSIERKDNKVYAIYSSHGRHCGEHPNFMKALSCYIDSCAVVIAHAELKEVEAWIDTVVSEPEIRTWGVREKKSIWQKVKGWFK